MAKTTTKFLPILITVVLLPQIAFAAWWNPISWFKTKPATIDQSMVEEQLLQNNELVDSNKPEVVQEKIIERVITVNDPQIQIQINQLIKENLELKSKINSLTAELNTYKSTNSNYSNLNSSKISDSYSDLNFKYAFNGNNTVSLLSATSRDIKIKKAVFTFNQKYSETFIKELDKPGYSAKIEIAGKSYNLERTNTSTFSYIGSGIPILGNENIAIKVVSTNGVTFNMAPDWSLWEIWDYTSNKPIRIE